MMNGHLAAIEEFLDTFDHCHVCHGQLALDDLGPVHCEDCSGDCEDHAEPHCAPIHILHKRARRALKAVREETEP